MWTVLASGRSLVAAKVSSNMAHLRLDHAVLRLTSDTRLHWFLRTGTMTPDLADWWRRFSVEHNLRLRSATDRRAAIHAHEAEVARFGERVGRELCIEDTRPLRDLRHDAVPGPAARYLIGADVVLLAARRDGACWRCLRRRLRAAYAWRALSALPLQQRYGLPLGPPSPTRLIRAMDLARKAPYPDFLVAVTDESASIEALLPTSDCSCTEGVHRPFRPQLMVGAHAGTIRDVIVHRTPDGAFAAQTVSTVDPELLGCRSRTVGGSAVRADPDEARTIAIVEAAERLAGSAVPRLARRAAVVDLVASQPYADPRRMCTLVPEEVITSLHIGWTMGVRARDSRAGLVPAAAVYAPYRDDDEPRWLPGITTGLAAGRSLEDAAMRSFLEIIERDSWALTWQTASPIMAVTPCCEVVQACHLALASGRQVRLGLLAVNQGAVVALAWSETERPSYRVAFGLRAAVSVHTALIGSLYELGQSQLHVDRLLCSKDIPDQVATMDDHYTYYCRRDRRHWLDFLRSTTVERVSCRSTTDMSASDGYVVVAHALLAGGFDPWVIDVTTADVRWTGIHVTRAVVPGALILGYGRTRPANLDRVLADRGVPAALRGPRPPRPAA
jgi:thiazole/oxazole-forming peptide maturase SagD family component